MNILITGCNGQLGREIQKLQNSDTENVFFNTDIAVDTTQGSRQERLDITDAEAVDAFIDMHAIGGIVNCAAYTAVDKAEKDAVLCRQLNAEAPGILARSIERRGGWILHASTDYVFDGTAHKPYTEDSAVCPVNVYGKTKLEGEQNVLERCRRAMIIRTAWLYSEHGSNFVKTMLRLGLEREELGVVADQIGTPTYAADLAGAIMTIIGKGIAAGVYHYSNEGVASWYDFTLSIMRLAGITTCHIRPIHTSEYPTPAARPFYSVLDKTKIKEAFGIEIPHWEASLAECVGQIKRVSDSY